MNDEDNGLYFVRTTVASIEGVVEAWIQLGLLALPTNVKLPKLDELGGHRPTSS